MTERITDETLDACIEGVEGRFIALAVLDRLLGEPR